jgi:hypothetical protein
MFYASISVLISTWQQAVDAICLAPCRHQYCNVARPDLLDLISSIGMCSPSSVAVRIDFAHQ